MIAPRRGGGGAGSWTGHVDEGSGATYYYNSVTGATQWEMPAEMQGGGHAQPSASGGVDFLSLAMGGGGGGTTAASASVDPAGSRAARQARREKRKALRKERPRLLNLIMKQKLNKNYVHISSDYRQRKKYQRGADGRAFPADAVCVMCRASPPTDVFFPCDHRACCRACVAQHNIGTKHVPGGPAPWRACPLCMAEIKVVFPGEPGGAELEKYWAWVYSVAPPLPFGFKRRFAAASAERIRRRSVGGEQSQAAASGGDGDGDRADVVVKAQGGGQCCVIL